MGDERLYPGNGGALPDRTRVVPARRSLAAMVCAALAVSGGVGFVLGRLSVTENNPFVEYSVSSNQVYVDVDGDGQMDFRFDESYKTVQDALVEQRERPRRYEQSQ